MDLDVRVPIGVLFCLIGGVIAGYGLLTLGDAASRPTGIPINAVWGTVMLVFGAVLLMLARRAHRRGSIET